VNALFENATLAVFIACLAPVVALNGGVGLYVLAIVVLQIVAGIPAILSLVLIALVFVPYVVLATLRPRHIAGLRVFPPPVRSFLSAALTPGARSIEQRRAAQDTVDENSTEESASAGPTVTTRASFELLALVPALFAIVAGSVGLVSTAIVLGNRFHVPQTLTAHSCLQR
jgi:ABC-type amino acid transport system permease subunit